MDISQLMDYMVELELEGLQKSDVYNKDGAKRHHNFRHFSAFQAF